MVSKIIVILFQNFLSLVLEHSRAQSWIQAGYRHCQPKEPINLRPFSIGVEKANYSVISTFLSNSSYRKSFYDSSIKAARLYGFQGLDFPWGNASTTPDMTNKGTLFEEWRAAVNSEARNISHAQLMLTAAVKSSPDVGGIASLPVESILRNLDWILGMPYGYHSPKDNFTGAYAAYVALHNPSSQSIIKYSFN
ncbi:class V chitinase-like [Ziziphus jujuba]|uniref:Class V chitinase-like n=1 Tax=Ziziphus jujuba TaxID=326968 RepID=A0ABM3ZXL4_ZIZJJ|nr:class V chitinase-like [Ziziphus jujuba]